MKNLLLKSLSIICLLLVACEGDVPTQIDNSPKEMILATAVVGYDSIAANMRYKQTIIRYGVREYIDTNFTLTLPSNMKVFTEESFQGRRGDTLVFSFNEGSEYANSRDEKGNYDSLLSSGYFGIVIDTNEKIIKSLKYTSSWAIQQYNTNFNFPLSSFGDDEGFTLSNIPYTRNRSHPQYIDIFIREADIQQLASNFKHSRHLNSLTYTDGKLTHEQESSNTLTSFAPFLKNSHIWLHLEIAYKNI